MAFYLRNHPAYMEGVGACFKARLTHVNVNYRYVATSSWYILDNADSEIVIYQSKFADQIAKFARTLPKVELWIEVSDGTPRSQFAVSFDELAEIGDGRAARHPPSRRRHVLPVYRRHYRHAERRDVGARRSLAGRLPQAPARPRA